MFRRTFTLGTGILAAGLMCFGATGAASGAVVYQDNFDNVNNNQIPNPTVGTYYGGGAQAKARNNVPGPTVAPYNGAIAVAPSGPNYMFNTRKTAGYHGYGGGFKTPATTGEVIHAEFDLFMIDGIPAIGFHSTQSFAHPTDSGVLGVTPGMSYLFPPTTTHPRADRKVFNSAGLDPNNPAHLTGLEYTLAAWQRWEIDYTVGASTFDLTIDGNTVAVDVLVNPNATEVVAIVFTGRNGYTEFLVDNLLVTVVPEPASLGLLGLGGLLLAARRRQA